MDRILEDFSPSSLTTAIEANLFELYRYWGSSTTVEFYDSPKVTWVLTGVLHPFMNGIFHTRLTPDVVDETIEKTLSRFRARQGPFLWWTGSTPRPPDLAEHLEAYGLIDTGGTPGMAVDLWALNEQVAAPAGLRTIPVHNTATLIQWVQALVVGFTLSTTSETICFDLFASLGFEFPSLNYVGVLHGKPVATSTLFLGAGVAGIYCVATVPEARRQGIGRALTLAPLQDARAMGYRIGILHSSTMGLNVYRRIGFRKYCQLRSRMGKMGS